MSRRVPFLLAIAATLSIAAPAQGATLAGDQACYQENEAVNFTATGFTPNGKVNFSRDNQAAGQLIADGAGNLRGRGFAPRISPSRQRAFSLEARDQANPANVAAITPLATRFRVRVVPVGGNPARRRTIRARGFTEGRTLYMHVRKGRRKIRNARLGLLKRPCGTKVVRRKRIFRRKTKPGVYRVQFDAQRRYSRRAFPREVYRVTIFPTAGVAGPAFTSGHRWVRIH